MNYNLHLERLGMSNLTQPLDIWKAVNNEYFELSKRGIIQPYEYVLKLLKKDKNLFFVDIGAHDGLSCSNSAYLEFFLQADGICIEPHPHLFGLLEKSRKCKLYNCCINDSEGFVDFVTITGQGDALSGIESNMSEDHKQRILNEKRMTGDESTLIKIKSRKLNSILEENNVYEIDYLSIDTEGSEYKILQGIDFEKFKINIISAENATDSQEVRVFLEQKGYSFIVKCCADEIYMKS